MSNSDLAGNDRIFNTTVDLGPFEIQSLGAARILTINTVGTGTVTPSTGTTYNDGATASLTATPAVGYLFDGWSGDATGSTNALSVTMDADKSITATFSAIAVQRTLTVAKTGNGTVTPAVGTHTYADGDMVSMTAVPDAGYQFDGWSGDETGTTNPLSVTMNADKNITATFSQIQGTQRSLSITVVGDGSVTPMTGSYNDGSSVTLTATPDIGWEFDGWSGDATGTTNPLSVVMNADKTITATFVRITVTLRSLSVTKVGSGNVTPWTGTYADGDKVVLTAVPSTGWEFDSWSGDASGNTNPYELTMDADKNVSATFIRIKRTLTTNVIGDGKVIPGTGVFNDGTDAILTAIPETGWQFDGWSGDAVGTMNPLAIILDTDKSITANFSKIPTSVEDLEDESLVLFPNPTQDMLNIQIENGFTRLTIYNLQGQKVLESTSSRIDVSSLTSATYLIKVETKSGRNIKKWFIKI